KLARSSRQHGHLSRSLATLHRAVAAGVGPGQDNVDVYSNGGVFAFGSQTIALDGNSFRRRGLAGIRLRRLTHIGARPAFGGDVRASACRLSPPLDRSARRHSVRARQAVGSVVRKFRNWDNASRGLVVSAY